MKLSFISLLFKNLPQLEYLIFVTNFYSISIEIFRLDGTSTPPFMKKENPVYFFVDDVCRFIDVFIYIETQR